MRQLLPAAVFVFLAVTSYVSGECAPDKKQCVFYFSIKEKLTMIHKKDLVYASGGKLYKYYDSSNDPNAEEVDINEVVTVDGVNRMAITVNETIPGPPIIVYEGQEVIVHVHNYLLSDSVTIHWHGLHQKNTPWMDGVGWVSQCPVASGQTFTYQFKASPKGTFWYHSHVGAQRSNGLYGALIIKEKPTQTATPEDRIMLIGDWHHESAEEVYIKMVYGNFIGREKYNTSTTLDGGRFSGVPWVSGLINGKGRYLDPKTGKKVEAPLEKITVKKGETYRFRVIQVGTIYPLRVSVDNHNISVVASDGYDVTPVECESLIVNPGERYDFLLIADQPVENYWIRTVSMETNVQDHTAEAILHYEGASTTTEPTTSRQSCETASRCKVVNCPFRYFPADQNMDCILVSELTSPDDSDPAPEFVAGDSKEHFLNFAFPGKNVTPGAINGHKFEFPGVNSLTQDDEIDNYSCDKHECGHDKVCYCHYQLTLPHKKTIQMVWLNVGRGAGWGHPMHLHGHSFYVLKMGYPPQNATSGLLMDVADDDNSLFNKDIDCFRNKSPGYEFCNEAGWMNKSWEGGKVPGLNTKNPPRKDTLIIPTGAYAVLRIRSDNPGKWFLHCHIEVHALDGMAMIINEAPDQHPTPPKGFPVCQNFYNDHSKDYQYVRDDDVKEDCDNNEKTLLIVCIVLAAVCFVLLAVLIVVVCRSKSINNKTSSMELQK